MQRSPWRNRARLSSAADAAETFLEGAGFDRGPWLAVAFASGIAAWFAIPHAAGWAGAMLAGLLTALAAAIGWREKDDRARLMAACLAVGLLFSAGVGTIWARSELVGTPALERPASIMLTGRILERTEQPAQSRTRLVLAARDAEGHRAMRLRVNLPMDRDRPEYVEGAVVSLRARLMPPASPMLPGAYDFARAAWFQGLAATGSVQGDVTLVEPVQQGAVLASLQRRLSDHVRAQLDGSPGAIAAAFASGDRGAITPGEEDAMRDSGLTHLLSISGVHVSALIAAVYFVAMRLLALWPWLALRVRLPLLAALLGALAGVGYTLLTGAEVPTIRSCAAAVLVLGALTLGREPLSLRMVAVAAMLVLLLWPESLVGPSFQMSFAAVIAIVVLHDCAPVKAFLAARDESWLARTGRRFAMLLLTGLVIELVLTPIVLFHFHRAGFYGALANMIAIPLVSFISMPGIALGLALDTLGLGAPAWWITGKSLELLLWIADFTANQPGAVKHMAQIGRGTFALFLIGGFWLALWRGRARLWGLLPVALAAGITATTVPPDLLISGDGHHVGVAGEGDRLIVLRDTRSDYTRDKLTELAGMGGPVRPMRDWNGARCSRDFCVTTLKRGGRDWHILMARSRERVEERALAAACERSDIVVADRWLPASCRPRWLKADGRMLSRTGGLAITLDTQRVDSVAAWQGDHGWWRGRRD